MFDCDASQIRRRKFDRSLFRSVAVDAFPEYHEERTKEKKGVTMKMKSLFVFLYYQNDIVLLPKCTYVKQKDIYDEVLRHLISLHF
mmetsp:Transcript_2054/g.4749  ORF Transcript_2054/g.4749 Transcript_2054/m.4749 type:complete len:86 (-) Transcript_2054:1861-2118(-)